MRKTPFLAVILTTFVIGCSSGTKVDGPSTGFNHSVDTETGGVKRQIKLKIDPSFKITPRESVEPATESGWEEVSWSPEPEQESQSEDLWAKLIEEAVRNGAGIQLDYTETIPLNRHQERSSGEASGPSMKTTNTDGKFDFETFIQTIPFPWGGSSGSGAASLNAEIMGIKVNWLQILGGFVILGAIIPLIRKPRDFVLSGIVVGCGLFIVTVGAVYEKYPILLAVLFLVVLIAGGWVIWQAWKSNWRSFALRKVATGIENLPTPEKEAVKMSIEEAVGDDDAIVRPAIRRAKQKEKKKKA